MQDFQDIPDDIKENIIDFHAGKITDNQAGALLKWLNESQDNKRFFDDITQIWHASVVLDKSKYQQLTESWEEVMNRLVIEKPTKSSNSSNSIKISIFLKVAASIGLLFGLGSSIYLFTVLKSTVKQNQYFEMTSPFGSRSFVTLSDGTKVWLNSGSHLKVPVNFGEHTRDITLSGEAYFTVAKDKHKPFIVHTSDINITALGTSFNVKAYSDEPVIETTLEEGSVKIESNHIAGSHSDAVMLMPKQKAVYQRDIEKTMVVTHPQKKAIEHKQIAAVHKTEKCEMTAIVPKISHLEDLRPVTSWKDERWFIKQETLEELVRKLERRYDVTVVFDNPEIKQFSFTGSLQDESIEQILHIIQLTAPIDYTVKHKTVTLLIDNQLKEKYKKLLMEQP